MKLCVTCNKTSRYKGRIGAWHPVSNFSPSEHTGNGYASACKDCSSGKNRVESVKEKEAKTTSSLTFILNQATKNLTSTQAKGTTLMSIKTNFQTKTVTATKIVLNFDEMETLQTMFEGAAIEAMDSRGCNAFRRYQVNRR